MLYPSNNAMNTNKVGKTTDDKNINMRYARVCNEGSVGSRVHTFIRTGLNKRIGTAKNFNVNVHVSKYKWHFKTITNIYKIV